jgi:hypothetical protein
MKEDKMSGKIVSIFVALIFVFVSVSVSLAESGVRSVKCPQGWHVVAGSTDKGGAFTCVPNKPKEKIKCPPNYLYFEKECALGCQPDIK